jgi:hypothetical protein
MQQMQHFYEPMPSGKGVRPQCGEGSADVISLWVPSKRQKYSKIQRSRHIMAQTISPYSISTSQSQPQTEYGSNADEYGDLPTAEFLFVILVSGVSLALFLASLIGSLVYFKII